MVLFKEKPVGILAWFIPCRICRLKWKHDTTECGLVCDSLENWVARYFPAPLIIPDICLFLRIIKFFIKNVRPKNNWTISLPCISSSRVANHVKIFVNQLRILRYSLFVPLNGKPMLFALFFNKIHIASLFIYQDNLHRKQKKLIKINCCSDTNTCNFNVENVDWCVYTCSYRETFCATTFQVRKRP